VPTGVVPTSTQVHPAGSATSVRVFPYIAVKVVGLAAAAVALLITRLPSKRSSVVALKLVPAVIAAVTAYVFALVGAVVLPAYLTVIAPIPVKVFFRAAVTAFASLS